MAHPISEIAKARIYRVKATQFGGSDDENNSAYTGKLIDGDNTLGVALPARVPLDTTVDIRRGNQLVLDVPVVDVGPWNTDDAYWDRTGSVAIPGDRDMVPRAVSDVNDHGLLLHGVNKGKKSNGGGLDMTPFTAGSLGLDHNDNAEVEWAFSGKGLLG